MSALQLRALMGLQKLKYNATLLERKLYNYANVLFSNQLVMLSCSLQASSSGTTQKPGTEPLSKHAALVPAARRDL